MTIRLISQWLTFLISIASLVMLLVGLRTSSKWRWLLILAGCFVSIDVIFYFIVLILGLGSFGSTISPFRSALQEGILFAVIRWFLSNLSNRNSSWK